VNAAECLLSVGADDAVALECGDARITYSTLREAVRRAAGAWRALGVAAGTRVIMFAPDSIDWVIAYLGVIHAGGVAIGVNPRLALADLGPIVNDSEVRYVWCEADAAPGIVILASTLPAMPAVVALGGGEGHDWAAALRAAAAIDACARADDDPALWIGTSGTTGIPKGVIHAQRAAQQPHSFAAGVLGATCDDRFYATSKLFFAYALANSLFAGLRLGATVILERDRPTPERVRAGVARYRPTILFTVPTLYSTMLQEGVAPSLAGRGIRHFVSAGEALPGSVRSAWAAAAGMPPISGYGTSETLCLVLYANDESGQLQPTPLTSIRHADGTDGDAPQRVWIRNPTLALGYWRRPEAQADGFRDGWFSPGDMFLRRGGDRLEFAGRTDDLLKVSGQWVSTLWIEHALAEAAGGTVLQVAAVGVTTPDGLTTVAAMAVPAPGCEAEARRRVDAAIEKLPKHRRPCWMHWVRELPLTATGKLQRSSLREVHEKAVERSPDA
jgi:acyl-coenzyme A synthetase/AMP-(fatty) acid ligase